ncbi:MAG: hypothetical protein AAGE80_05335 [Pseudomonadota bacterium]
MAQVGPTDLNIADGWTLLGQSGEVVATVSFEALNGAFLLQGAAGETPPSSASRLGVTVSAGERVVGQSLSALFNGVTGADRVYVHALADLSIYSGQTS